MSGNESETLTGPDLAAGLSIDELTDGEPVLGHARGEAVVVVRRGGDVFAIGSSAGAPTASPVASRKQA